MTKTFENDAILLFDGNRGVYIPQNFAEEIKQEYVSGVSKEDLETLLAGPDHEWYWEAWNNVEQGAVITVPETGLKYTIYQDGDVWLVPEDCEFPDQF